MSRLISRDLIPITLWDEVKTLMFLPPQLVNGWKLLLEQNGLLDKAMLPNDESFLGGQSKEDSDNHFAWKFNGSAARIMLTMIDPNQELDEIPDVFTKFFSGNRVFLVDVPCGAGAAALSILSVYCELRKQGLIPREPLEVIIVGGELSPYAQSYARDGLSNLLSELEKQAINLSFEVMDWDVCDPVSNTELIKCLTVKSQGCSAKVLLVANFSGFLTREEKWKDANEQLEELFRYNLGKNSVALWIEPNMNNVTKPNALFQKIVSWFSRNFSYLKPKDAGHWTSSVRVQHPLNDGSFPVTLAVKKFELS